MKKRKKRNFGRVILPAVAFSLLMLFPAVTQTQQKETKAPIETLKIKPGDFIPSQIAVFAKTKNAKKDILKLAGAVGAAILHENTRFDVFLFSFLTDADAEGALKKINKKYVGLYSASRNWKFGIPPTPKSPRKTQGDTFRPQHVTNDPGFQASWWLQKIKEPYAGAPLAGDKNIAIIDTGVDYTHSDLSGKVVSAYDYVNWDSDAMDDHGHGTHCAGIAAAKANNATGIHGVSPNSKIYAYKVLDREGWGGWYQIMAAITDAADNPNVSILSLSLGGYDVEGTSTYTTFRSAVNYARWTKGKIVCVAAGNEYNDTMYSNIHIGTQVRVVPGYFPASFTVAASDFFDSRADFSNYDVNTTSGDGTATYNFSFVDIVAPGYSILSSVPGERYDSWNGTSMATPMVAGACARVWGKNPGFTAAQVQSKLSATGRFVGASLGWPVPEKRIDLMKALGVSETGLQGMVYQAESGYPLYNVKVEAHSGSASGPLAATVYSDKAGTFTFTGLAGATNYYLIMSKAGFKNLTVWGGTPTANDIKDIGAPFFLLPNRWVTATDENWRIVTTWRDTQPGWFDFYSGYYSGYSSTYYPYEYYQSAGLEANAYLEDPDGYVYSWDNPGWLGISPYVSYTYDSFNGIPLECHVIQQPKTGVYRYVLSSSPDDWCWGVIKYGAGGTIYPGKPVVKIYKGNTLKATIKSASATQDGTGTMYWHVFDLNTASGAITIVNNITDTWPL